MNFKAKVPDAGRDINGEETTGRTIKMINFEILEKISMQLEDLALLKEKAFPALEKESLDFLESIETQKAFINPRSTMEPRFSHKSWDLSDQTLNDQVKR